MTFSPQFRTRTTLVLTLGVLAASPLSTSYAIFDKTRFVAHLGAAYFAFHHWTLNPYKQGKFSAGAPGRTVNLVKAGAALLFAAHEVSVARKIAHNSNSPLLQKLDGGLTNLTSSFTGIGNRLKSGQLNPADIQSLESQTGSLSSAAAANGAPIRDLTVPVPGL
jgi:hypothetical protein